MYWFREEIIELEAMCVPVGAIKRLLKPIAPRTRDAGELKSALVRLYAFLHANMQAEFVRLSDAQQHDLLRELIMEILTHDKMKKNITNHEKSLLIGNWKQKRILLISSVQQYLKERVGEVGEVLEIKTYWGNEHTKGGIHVYWTDGATSIVLAGEDTFELWID